MSKESHYLRKQAKWKRETINYQLLEKSRHWWQQEEQSKYLDNQEVF